MKLFESKNKIQNVRPKKRATGFLFPIVLGCIISFSCLFVLIEKKEKKNKNENMLIEKLQMKNGMILTKKVKYDTFRKADPQDTSDIFFQVIVGNDEYEKGDLIVFNPRFVQERQFEGETYCYIQADQVHSLIKKEDVKENLLK